MKEDDKEQKLRTEIITSERIQAQNKEELSEFLEKTPAEPHAVCCHNATTAGRGQPDKSVPNPSSQGQRIESLSRRLRRDMPQHLADAARRAPEEAAAILARRLAAAVCTAAAFGRDLVRLAQPGARTAEQHELLLAQRQAREGARRRRHEVADA